MLMITSLILSHQDSEIDDSDNEENLVNPQNIKGKNDEYFSIERNN